MVVLGAAFLLLLVRTAWVCDDAYVSFRVVDNALHGYGLRWNVVERVQAFTSPLWTLAMIPAVALTREVYFTCLALGIALSLAAFLVLGLRLARTPLHAALVLPLLILSKSWVDYSTSGLENPLSHLLLLLFCGTYLDEDGARGRPLRLGILAGLLALNRLDNGVLVAVPLACELIAARTVRVTRAVALGLLPVAAWMLFSLVYYGFPFPNTAYAKLHTGIPQSVLWTQGALYFVSTAEHDPLILAVIVAALVAAVARPVRGSRPLAAGIVLHLLYVASVGGDFMAGRFLTLPLAAAVAILARLPYVFEATELALAVGTALVLAYAAPHPSILGDRHFGNWPEAKMDPRGVADERAFFYGGTGLLLASRASAMPTFAWADIGRRARAAGTPVMDAETVGMIGYFAGPGTYVIDRDGLGDPLLSRLPSKLGFRIGHFQRRIPPGYAASVLSDEPKMPDRELARFYKKMRTVTRGPIFSRERLRALWDVNLRSRAALSRYYAVWGAIQRTGVDALAAVRPEGQLPDERTIEFSDYGVVVDLGSVRHSAFVDLGLDANDSYEVRFLKGGQRLWKPSVPRVPQRSGLARRVLRVDADTRAAGYDAIWIAPEQGDEQYFLGHLRLLEEPPPDATPVTPDPPASPL